MAKYNFPPSSVDIILELQKRIERLELGVRAAPIPIHGIKAGTGANGSYNDGVVINSGTFADLFIFPGIYLAPVPLVVFNATCSDGTTSAELKLTLAGGVDITGPLNETVATITVPLGTTSEATFTNTGFNPNYWLRDAVGNELYLKLQGRRTAGAGTITIKGKYLVQVPG